MEVREDAFIGSARQVGRFPADLAVAVEVVSPGSRKNDRFFKPVEYAMAGIGVYLRLEIDPTLLLVVHELDVDRYRKVATFDGVAELTAPFPLRLDLRTLK